MLRSDIGMRSEYYGRQISLANRTAVQIEREVDSYVSTLDATKVDANAALASLRDVLTPLGEFTEESLFVSIWKPASVPPNIGCKYSTLSPRNTRWSEPWLILAFGIYKEFNQSSVTLRAYRSANGHFALVDATGHDFDNYASLSTRELHSSRLSPCDPARRAWFLMSGYNITANGPSNRMRAYSFDGRKLQIAWKPADTWGGWTITVTETGFIVEGDWYRPGRTRSRRDEYVVTDDGFIRRGPD